MAHDDERYDDADETHKATSLGRKASPKSTNDPKPKKSKNKKSKAKPEDEEETEEQRISRLLAIRAVINEWVWVSALGIYMNRRDPSFVLKKEMFNDKFRSLARGGLLSNFLHSRRYGTMLKPDRVVYRPNQSEFLAGGREWNLWRPSEIVAHKGDTTMWDAHLAYLFPDQKQRDHLRDWLAGVLQRLGIKPLHALLLIGVEQGTGKSWVLRVLAKLIGDSNWRPLPKTYSPADSLGGPCVPSW